MVKLLNKDKELALARAWLEEGDTRARNHLLDSYQPMVIKIARRYMRNGLDLDDLIQEGNIGFLAGLDNFDPDRGYSVGTLARFHIQAHIQLHVSEFIGLVRLPNSRRIKGLISKCITPIRFLESQIGRSLDMAEKSEICEAAGFSLDELEQYEMVTRPARSVMPRGHGEEGETGFEPADETSSPEDAVASENAQAVAETLIERLLAEFPPRTRTILSLRHLSDEFVSLDAIAREVGISRERVRRIEIEALEDLRKKLSDRGIADLSDLF